MYRSAFVVTIHIHILSRQNISQIQYLLKRVFYSIAKNEVLSSLDEAKLTLFGLDYLAFSNTNRHLVMINFRSKNLCTFKKFERS